VLPVSSDISVIDVAQVDMAGMNGDSGEVSGGVSNDDGKGVRLLDLGANVMDHRRVGFRR